METCISPTRTGRRRQSTRQNDKILGQSIPDAFVCYNKSHLFFSIVKHTASTSILYYIDVYVAMIDDNDDDDDNDELITVLMTSLLSIDSSHSILFN